MLLPEIFPMSLPAVVNRVDAPVVGRMHHEVSDRDIRQARVVLLEVHWYLSIPSALKIARRVRRINPSAQIVAGGISATMFTEQLLRDSPIDYIVRGDAERPAAWLVHALLEGRAPDSVPNVAGRDFEPTAHWAVDTATMDEGDYTTLDWFPTIQRRLRELHRTAAGWTFPTWPYLVVYRGCPLTCEKCCGSLAHQQMLFGRSWVLRSASAVRADLLRWSHDERITYVNLFHDFLYLRPSYWKEVLDGQQFDLVPTIELFRTPSEDALGAFLGAFRRGQIFFSLDQMHTTSAWLPNIDALIARIHQAHRVGGWDTKLAYAGRTAEANPAYKAALERVHRETSIPLARVDFWWGHNPMPGPDGRGSEADYRESCKPDPTFLALNLAFRIGRHAHRVAPTATRKLKALVVRHNGLVR